ncbi:MAG: hydrogenase maturation protease [Armatimonadota bacterium]|nr:hydrogenase maturation protease [Armatimonadota bacterium]
MGARDAGVLVIGVGNPNRGDDAAGLVAARLARARLAGTAGVSVLECDGDPARLIDRWAGAHAVIVVDAVRSGAERGRLHCLNAAARVLPTNIRPASSHAFGVAEAIELARALGCLPPRLVVYGIEAGSCALGSAPSPEVAAAAATAARRIVRAARRYARTAA